jgi:hypothetical protein
LNLTIPESFPHTLGFFLPQNVKDLPQNFFHSAAGPVVLALCKINSLFIKQETPSCKLQLGVCHWPHDFWQNAADGSEIV